MQKPPWIVAIGILARDEESGIAQVIRDLSEQSLLANGDVSLQIHVMANACTDRTAEVARNTFELRPFLSRQISTTVHELAQGGKSNAWNQFVHQILPDSTDFAIFLDGDIRIPDRGSLGLMLDSLIGSPSAVVAVDRSIKDIAFENPRRVVEKLIKVATGTADDPRTAIAGACYCARYSEICKIRMPLGLPGEDGFLRAMLLTSNFGHPEDTSRLVYVEDAYHVFESVRDLGGVLRHNVRLAIGTAVNILLFGHMRKLREQGIDVAEYIRARNADDPAWVNDLIRDRLKTSFFPLEISFVSRRLRRIRDKSAQSSPKTWMIALLGASFDLVVFAKATVLMRRGTGAGYW